MGKWNISNSKPWKHSKCPLNPENSKQWHDVISEKCTPWNLGSWTKLLYDGVKFPSVCVYKDVNERHINFMFRWHVKFFPQGSHYRYMTIFQILGNIKHLKHFWVPRSFRQDITPTPKKWSKPESDFLGHFEIKKTKPIFGFLSGSWGTSKWCTSLKVPSGMGFMVLANTLEAMESLFYLVTLNWLVMEQETSFGLQHKQTNLHLTRTDHTQNRAWSSFKSSKWLMQCRVWVTVENMKVEMLQ